MFTVGKTSDIGVKEKLFRQIVNVLKEEGKKKQIEERAKKSNNFAGGHLGWPGYWVKRGILPV